jgi:uncharacterized protein
VNILDLLTNGQASQLDSNGDGVQRLVANLMMQRSEWLRSLLDSSRNVDGDCGYPVGYIDPKLYWELYQREPIATRTVEVYPKESWQVNPQIFEDENVETITPFEEAWDALGKQLRGEQSFYQEEEASVVFDFLCDADIKCGIGHYAAILLGFDDGAPLDQPIDLIDAGKPAKVAPSASSSSSSGATRRLLFMQVYPETAVRINSLEADMQSPRYGLPTEYDISMMDPLEFSSLGVGTSLPSNRASVHWTRVVHISEYGVLHTPRQRPVLNRLLDLRKLYGGSAEMYWRGAFPGYAIKTQPQLGADVDINREDVKQQLTDYSNALQRFLVLMGMDITALAPQVSDPSSQIDKQVEAICIQLGIPKRIFMGSERGELASSQDDAAWNDRLKQRQLGVITPRIIIPFVDRLIATRVLPRPAKGYRVSWPDLTSKSDEEKAGIATQRTQAIAAYTAGQLETTLAPMDFWTRIMGFTEDEAQSIIANAEEVKQQKEKEQAAKDAEAARVQAEAQAKLDESAILAADATGTEQQNTAPGSPTSPGKPFGGKGSPSPTSAPPNASGGQPGGFNAGGAGSTPVAHSDPTLVADFDPSQPRDKGGKWAKEGGSGGEGFPRKTLAGISDKFRGEVLDFVKRQGWNTDDFEHRLDHEVHRLKTARAASPERYSSASHEDIVKHVMGQVMSQMRTEARQKDAEEFSKLREAKLSKDAPPPPVIGPSTADVKVVSKRSVKQVEDHIKKVIGEHATFQDVASLAGAASGATVSVTPGRQADRITVRVKHPDYASKRTIYRDSEGNLVIHNDEFFAKPGSTGKGLGAEVFGRQVENAQKHGVSRLETHAGGPPEMNGYYTWPRFGYDQSFTSLEAVGLPWMKKAAQSAREKFPGAKSVSDVFLHPDGPAWWKANGSGMPDSKFDLTPGSRSLKVWHAYVAERANRRPAPVTPSTAPATRAVGERPTDWGNLGPAPLTHAEISMFANADLLDPEIDEIGNGEENYDSSPEVESALDAAWEKLREELGGKSLVAHFDPSQTRDTHGRWSPLGKSNAFDYVLKRGTESNQTMRDFYKSVHEDVHTARPAGDSRFHDPLRLHIEKQLHELAGDHGEALYRTGKAGMTQIAFKNHEVNVITEAPGRITIFSKHLHGPDPRDPRSFTITHETPHEEVTYRLHKAAGLKVDKQLEAKYKTADKVTRDQFRAQRKAAQEAQEKAKEARRLEKRGSESSTQNADLSAEDISALINSGELDVNAICRDYRGRFASCGAAGLPPSESSGVSEARMVHARHLVEQIRGTKTPDAATVKELANHLGTLTVAQLHSLKKEYGLKASGKNKAALKEKLTARFSQKAGMDSSTAAAAAPTAPSPKATESTPVSPPPPPTPVHVPVGTFGTTGNITWDTPISDAHELARQVLGPNATAHDLVSVAGIPDGARVDVTTLEGAGKHAYVRATGSTQVRNPDTGEMEQKQYMAERTISVRPDGTRSIHNDSFEGKGSGLAMFGRQVENATKWGFTHIETYAAGSGYGTTGERPPEGAYNGYYTWPRFGYDGKISPVVVGKMPDNVYSSVEAAGGKVSGVMSTKEGRDWWLGHGDSLDVKFDLTPGSYSQDTLNTYLKHRGILK